ncbi:MAG: hypothetical protein AAFX40_02415 [Cyanobacteria bacterium J06639_1]
MRVKPLLVVSGLAAIAIASAVTFLGRQHPNPPGHHANGHDVGQLPTLVGQDAFAAVAEIVAMLERDRATDWERVDLDALRAHLIDMNQVMLSAAVDTRDMPGGLEMNVTGEGNAIASIQRMIPAHAAELDRMEWLSSSASEISDGVRWTVTSDRPSETVKIQGLGFAGLLVMGSHHQAHHLAIARGSSPHEH